MPKQIFKTSYNKNSGLILTPDDIKSGFLFGIPDFNSDGVNLSNKQYEFFIKDAQSQIEKFLSIKLFDQVIEESNNWHGRDWVGFGYIPTTYPVKKPLKLDGYFNQILQVEYPKDWLSIADPADDLYSKSINLLPVGSAASGGTIYRGTLSMTRGSRLGHYGSNNIPNFWKITYITHGYGRNYDIRQVIGKIASLSLANILGDIPSVGAGIANKSISIDGLSQSVGTTQSATSSALGARINEYMKELKIDLARLKDYYNPITWTVC